MAGFVDSYKRWYDAAPEGSVYRARMLNMILHLQMVVEPHQQAVEQEDDCDLSLLTDEELEQAVDARMLKCVEDNPAVAIKAAAKLGWVVIPPDEDS